MEKGVKDSRFQDSLELLEFNSWILDPLNPDGGINFSGGEQIKMNPAVTHDRSDHFYNTRSRIDSSSNCC